MREILFNKKQQKGGVIIQMAMILPIFMFAILFLANTGLLNMSIDAINRTSAEHILITSKQSLDGQATSITLSDIDVDGMLVLRSVPDVITELTRAQSLLQNALPASYPGTPGVMLIQLRKVGGAGIFPIVPSNPYNLELGAPFGGVIPDECREQGLRLASLLPSGPLPSQATYGICLQITHPLEAARATLTVPDFGTTGVLSCVDLGCGCGFPPDQGCGCGNPPDQGCGCGNPPNQGCGCGNLPDLGCGCGVEPPCGGGEGEEPELEIGSEIVLEEPLLEEEEEEGEGEGEGGGSTSSGEGESAEGGDASGYH